MSGMQRCLVIGANGFIGSHLVDELTAAGFAVRAFDRFSNPAQFKPADTIEQFQGDFFDDSLVAQALEGIDYVFHSFSATTPFTADADPYTDISSNVLRNIQLFQKAVEAGVQKVVFISSGGAVYGDLAEQKSASEQDVPHPVSPYGIGKLTSEHYLGYFQRKHGLNYIVYRLANPYGPRQVIKHNQGVIPAFIEKLSNGEPLTVIGDGTSSRDYLYIGDATARIAHSFQNAQHNLYNLGSGQQTSINDIIAALETTLGVRATIEHVEEPKTFLKHSGLNVERFTNEFGAQELTSLAEGLKLTLAARPHNA